MTRRRVAITGIGLVTALGTGAESTWAGLREGRSGIDRVRSFDVSSLGAQLGGEVADLNPKEWFTNRRALRITTRSEHLAMAGGTLAVRDAKHDIGEAERAGLFIGSSKEVSDLDHLLEPILAARGPDGSVDMQAFGEAAKTQAYPLFFVEGLQSAALFYLSEAFGLKGANTYFGGGAEVGAVSIGRAFRAVRRGEADVVIAGAYDDPVSWWNFTKFDAMGLLTHRNELGAQACRPFDGARDGTVFGEGAALVVLEDLETAVARGARIYAEVVGFGSSSDTTSLVTPDPQGRALTRAVESGLREAGSVASDIGFVAAQAIGTRGGDASEAQGLARLMGAGADEAAVTSVTAATGHLQAAAGALNVAVAALALFHQEAPPTLNLDAPDVGCELNWVRGAARQLHKEQALAVARGFEGQNVALILRAAP